LENITEIVDQRRETNLNLPVSTIDLVVASEAVDKLITEGGEGFYNYVSRIGLANDPSLVVLSSLHNYYYDSEEMKSVKTIINLKELNLIKQIKSLLYSHLHFLPGKCNFIGCFVNNKRVERYAIRNSSYPAKKTENSDNIELGIISRFPLINMLYSFLDSKTNIYMSERSVSSMFRAHGFRMMDMTESDGITFFHAQKVEETYN
jgi:hypothetical protein